MIFKTNCSFLANEKTMFNENIYGPTEFASLLWSTRDTRAALRDKIFNLRFVNNLNFGRVKMASYKI